MPESAFEVLAEPTRRRILDLLREEERPVGDLVRQLAVSQPAVSKHLRVLREAGLVEVKREGTRRVYSPRRQGLEQLRAYVESLWSDVLAAFSEAGGAGGPSGRGRRAPAAAEAEERRRGGRGGARGRPRKHRTPTRR